MEGPNYNNWDNQGIQFTQLEMEIPKSHNHNNPVNQGTIICFTINKISSTRHTQ